MGRDDRQFRDLAVRGRARVAGAAFVLLTMVAPDAHGQAAQGGGARPLEEHRSPAADAELLRYARVNGVTLAYRAEGAGVPVIFVHGEGFSHELWAEQLPSFRQKFLAISYDRRGHGSSEATTLGQSPLAHAEDLNALMAHLGLADAHFVVHSRGGAIITQFLRFHPEKVRSLTFADATILLVPPSEGFRSGLERRLRETVPTIEQALKRRENGKQSPFTKIARSRPEIQRVLDRMIDQASPQLHMDPQKSDFTGATNVGPWNAREFPDMKRLAKPILLVVGEFTDSFFIDGANAARKLWPNTRYRMIPNTDHLLALEAAGEFNKLVLDFLDEVDTAGASREDESRRD